jgi:hypothetical protein
MNWLTDCAAIIASVIVACLAVFQILLAAGLPYGHAAYGGTISVLPTKLRLASAVSSLVFFVAFYVILARGGLLGGEQRFELVTVAMWIFVALFGVSALANIVSRSHWERYLMAPIGLVLAVCCVILAFAS